MSADIALRFTAGTTQDDSPFVRAAQKELGLDWRLFHELSTFDQSEVLKLAQALKKQE